MDTIEMVTELRIGDTVPEETWNTPLKLYTASDNSTKTVRLADYRGKVIILDFWATWCSTCLYYMPHQFALQERFGSDLVTLPVTYEKAGYAGEFIRNSTYERLTPVKPVFRTIAENKSLLEHFPLNTSLPLIVVITPDGKVDAVTMPMLLTEEYVAGAIAGTERYAPLKRGTIEQLPPLLEYSLTDVRQYKPVYYTSISGEIDGSEAIGRHFRDREKGAVRSLFANRTVVGLYSASQFKEKRQGWGFSSPRSINRVIMEVKEPYKYHYHYDENTRKRTVFDLKWRRENCYTYETVMPFHTTVAQIRKRMVSDLNTFFGLDGRIEKRKVPVYVLTKNRSFDSNPVESTEKMLVIFNGWKTSRVVADTLIGANEQGYICYVRNMQMSLIHTQIALMFDRILDDPDNPMPIVIDETGIDPEKLVSIGFTKDMKASREELIENLRIQGLELISEEREIPMFVLTESGYEAAPGEKLILTKYGYLPESNYNDIFKN